MTSSPRRVWARRARRVVLALVAVAAGGLALAIHPQPLFAHSLQRANIVLHARDPLPPQAGPMLDEVVRRLARSPLYDPARVHHVFLCDTPGLFGLFSLWHRAGGITHVMFGGNAFIRPANVARDRVMDSSGREKEGERTLTYFIAHEVGHAITGDHVGRWRYRSLAPFQVEGYADYMAFDHRVDLRARRDALARGAPEMDPKRSGLYMRYETLVAYLLERRGLTVDELLARRIDRAPLEAELLADPAL
jgi:hypothetical protein